MKIIYSIILFLIAGINFAQEVKITGTKELNIKDSELDMPRCGQVYLAVEESRRKLQQRKITGTVRNVCDGEPIPGLDIFIAKSSAVKATTNDMGVYEITAYVGDRLLFFDGHRPKGIIIKNEQHIIDVSLEYYDDISFIALTEEEEIDKLEYIRTKEIMRRIEIAEEARYEYMRCEIEKRLVELGD